MDKRREKQEWPVKNKFDSITDFRKMHHFSVDSPKT